MPFLRKDDPHLLAVRMTGVKMGEHLLQIGCAHGGRLAAIAAQVGLSGRAVTVVPNQADADRARKGAARAGVLVEVEQASPTRLPADEQAFDVAIIDDTGGLLAAMTAADRSTAVREAVRVLRPGGRLMVIGSAPRGGLAGLLARGPRPTPLDAIPSLESDGLKAVRRLAERDGLVFVEGIKPR